MKESGLKAGLSEVWVYIVDDLSLCRQRSAIIRCRDSIKAAMSK